MKFRNKIIISFCIIIFVPIFLASLVLFSMQHIQMKAIEQTIWCGGGWLQLFFQFCPVVESVYEGYLYRSV